MTEEGHTRPLGGRSTIKYQKTLKIVAAESSETNYLCISVVLSKSQKYYLWVDSLGLTELGNGPS